MKDKEQAFSDWFSMIQNSWTWKRLTQGERDKFEQLLDYHLHLRGTYQQRRELLHDVYFAFLVGVGYSSVGWRETGDAPLF